MKIYEIAFDPINIDGIVIDETRGNANNTYFTDGNHTYHFSTSKNTLYMIFDEKSTIFFRTLLEKDLILCPKGDTIPMNKRR